MNSRLDVTALSRHRGRNSLTPQENAQSCPRFPKMGRLTKPPYPPPSPLSCTACVKNIIQHFCQICVHCEVLQLCSMCSQNSITKAASCCFHFKPLTILFTAFVDLQIVFLPFFPPLLFKENQSLLPAEQRGNVYSTFKTCRHGMAWKKNNHFVMDFFLSFYLYLPGCSIPSASSSH